MISLRGRSAIVAKNRMGRKHRSPHAARMIVAVIDRPPQSFRALAAPAAQALARYRLPENQAGRLADQRAPAWVFLSGMKPKMSSTGLRNPDGSWRTK